MTNMAKCAYRGVCMATGVNQVRVLACWHAEATSADTKQTDAEPLATLSELAYSPDPIQKLHRVPKREQLR